MVGILGDLSLVQGERDKDVGENSPWGLVLEDFKGK